MISPRDDIDEPDIIGKERGIWNEVFLSSMVFLQDLTASVRSYHFVDPPLRPPSPFADEQRQTKRTRPKKPIIVTSRKNVIRSSSESRVQRIRSHWQQALHRFLKREKGTVKLLRTSIESLFGSFFLVLRRIVSKRFERITNKCQTCSLDR